MFSTSHITVFISYIVTQSYFKPSTIFPLFSRSPPTSPLPTPLFRYLVFRTLTSTFLQLNRNLLAIGEMMKTNILVHNFTSDQPRLSVANHSLHVCVLFGNFGPTLLWTTHPPVQQAVWQGSPLGRWGKTEEILCQRGHIKVIRTPWVLLYVKNKQTTILCRTGSNASHHSRNVEFPLPPFPSVFKLCWKE